jgi:CRP-like cAMP-binding protein
MAGKASTLDVPLLQSAAEHSASFRAALIRYEQVIHVQALQSAACNASHSVESRLARWLLRARDLSDCDTLTFSQEFLAEMLGKHRNSVSVVASSLQEAGLIRYSRGQIEITDLEGLVKRSCECYGTVKTRSHELLQRV